MHQRQSLAVHFMHPDMVGPVNGFGLGWLRIVHDRVAREVESKVARVGRRWISLICVDWVPTWP